MVFAQANLGADDGFSWSKVWDAAKGTTIDIVKSIPGAATGAVQKTIVEKVTPLAQQVATAKTERVLNKGNVALMLVGGGALGALLAGGSWQRRAIGAATLATAGFAVGWQ